MNLRVDEIDGSEFAHLVEVRDDSEWVLATVYPGTQISHPIRPEVRALSAKRARMIESALAPLVDRWLAARDALEKTDPYVSMTDTRAAIREYDEALVAIVEARRGPEAASALAGVLAGQRVEHRS